MDVCELRHRTVKTAKGLVGFALHGTTRPFEQFEIIVTGVAPAKLDTSSDVRVHGIIGFMKDGKGNIIDQSTLDRNTVWFMTASDKQHETD